MHASLTRLSLPSVLAPITPIILLAACMDYELAVGSEGFPPELEDSAVQYEPPADDTAVEQEPEPEPEDSDPPEEEEEPEEPEEPEDDSPVAGCSDGEREGFQSWDEHPHIAACAGGWSVGGVTRADLAPVCRRGAGDDSWNTEGDGCSAADLCAEGWHVCQGKTEVAAYTSSCDAAVPDGTPDKSLFFAVSQHSYSDSVCDDGAAEGNDVFGCGNLGTQLDSGKNCGVLTRVLASMNPNSCGYNEAEPSHGPWECNGGDDSHYHEGELVTKIGCWSSSCEYDGNAVGNSDKGGVLCCRDS